MGKLIFKKTFWNFCEGGGAVSVFSPRRCNIQLTAWGHISHGQYAR